MSRSGYDDDCSGWDLIRWRGAVASAIRGKRGQAFLKEMLAAMDALPEPKLIADELEIGGEVCALGSIGRVRGMMMAGVDAEDHDLIARLFAIPHTLACEIMFQNDDGGRARETPEARFARMRAWVDEQIRKEI